MTEHRFSHYGHRVEIQRTRRYVNNNNNNIILYIIVAVISYCSVIGLWYIGKGITPPGTYVYSVLATICTLRTLNMHSDGMLKDNMIFV